MAALVRRVLVTVGGLIALGALSLLMAGNASASTGPDQGSSGTGGLVGSLVAPVTNTAGAVVAPVTRTVETVVAPVTKTVGAVVAPVTKAVATVAASVVAPVTRTVGAVTAPVVRTVVAPVAKTADAVLAPVTSTVAPVTNVAGSVTAPAVRVAPVAHAAPTVAGNATVAVQPVAWVVQPVTYRQVTTIMTAPRHSKGMAQADPAGAPASPWSPVDQAFGGAVGTASASSGGTSGAGNAVSANQGIPSDTDARWARAPDASSAPQRWCPYGNNHPS